MDTANQSVKNTQHLSLSPAQLFIGPDHATFTAAQTAIKKALCNKNGCNNCITCQQIDQHQHHALLWLQPEKQYTREQLQPLFNTITFALDSGQQFFFVIQSAQQLTTACANSLLKSLEEPPPGYHFLLLTNNTDRILPTIRSRCTQIRVNSHADTPQHQELFSVFTTTSFSDPVLFLKNIQQTKITEYESIALIDRLLEYWTAQYKEAIINNNKTTSISAQHVIDALNNALTFPPMPGSSKLLWKDLFLHIKAI